jgi:hypothetical protein
MRKNVEENLSVWETGKQRHKERCEDKKRNGEAKNSKTRAGCTNIFLTADITKVIKRRKMS